jgi:predicted TIM-barrel fold metal-dependent hydrolase
MTLTQDKYRLISADDHVDLSHDQIKSNLATKFHEDYDQAIGAFVESMMPMLSASANQLWKKQNGEATDEEGELWGFSTGNHPAKGRPGHTVAKERLADMDFDGIESSITYCEVSAFRYLFMLKEGSKEATRAFNTTLLNWAAEDPKRLRINFQIPIHDIDAAIAEVKHAAEVGVKSIQMPVFPNELGLPDYWDERYIPLLATIEETGIPIALHIGLNTALDSLAQRDPTPQRGIFVPMVPLSAAESLGMWLLTGIFERFPRLKTVFVEPGVGWVNWWLYTVDDMNTRQGYDYPGLKELPSHYFRQNVFITFIDEPGVLQHARQRLGVENIMWSSDYPHPVSSWPHSQDIASHLFPDATVEERDNLLFRNAERVWDL